MIHVQLHTVCSDALCSISPSLPLPLPRWRLKYTTQMPRPAMRASVLNYWVCVCIYSVYAYMYFGSLIPTFCSMFTPHAHVQQGLSNRVDVCLSVRRWTKILKTNNQLKYSIIRSENGTITTFELLFEGHSTDSTIYNLLELQILSFLISYYSSPAPPL